jgi:large subunit ribosomal protein L33
VVSLAPAVILQQKNKKNNPERLELKKYNPILKKMTVHKEIK